MVGGTGGEGVSVVAEEIAEVECVGNWFYHGDLTGLWCLIRGIWKFERFLRSIWLSRHPIGSGRGCSLHSRHGWK